MVTKKQQQNLLNFNRLMIYLFALIGLFFDYTWAYFISLTLWVWLIPCMKYERLVYDYINQTSHLHKFENKR